MNISIEMMSKCIGNSMNENKYLYQNVVMENQLGCEASSVNFQNVFTNAMNALNIMHMSVKL